MNHRARRMHRAFPKLAALLCLIGLCLMGGCQSSSAPSEKESPSFVGKANGNRYCRVDGTVIYFAADEERERWRAPLAKLLSNVRVAYGEGGEILGYQPVDPDSPSIPDGYRYGLLDITADGTPELLVFPYGGGGSAGNATYEIYDILSGAYLGSINGGHEESWCVYYDTEAREVELIGQFQWRCGWQNRVRFIQKMGYDEERGEYYDRDYLSTYHTIDGETTDIRDEDPNDMFYTGTWVETYTDTHYLILDEEVYLDDYYAEYDAFVKNCVRLPETALKLFRWSDVSVEEDDYGTRAEKMADALLSSGQEFVR